MPLAVSVAIGGQLRGRAIRHASLYGVSNRDKFEYKVISNIKFTILFYLHSLTVFLSAQNDLPVTTPFKTKFRLRKKLKLDIMDVQIFVMPFCAHTVKF